MLYAIVTIDSDYVASVTRYQPRIISVHCSNHCTTNNCPLTGVSAKVLVKMLTPVPIHLAHNVQPDVNVLLTSDWTVVKC